jgi:hypothetical protein
MVEAGIDKIDVLALTALSPAAHNVERAFGRLWTRKNVSRTAEDSRTG